MRIFARRRHNGLVNPNVETVSDDSNETTDAASEPKPSRSPVGTIMRWVGFALIGATFLIWIYAFSGQARRDIPDRLDDRTFSELAEPRCAVARQQVDAIPLAVLATDGQDRANQVTESTDILESMVDDIETMITGTERDHQMLEGWISDWRVHIHDRRRYATAVAEDQTAAFLVTDTNIGEQLERRISRFAVENYMPSCENPGDVG